MSYESRHRIAQQSDAFVTPVLPRPSLGRRLAATLRRWRERSAARRYLAAMDARSLRDAGISPAAAAYESGKSFWQPFGPLR
ncbi:MAG: hypothetical protein QOG78_3785 [Rhodospirillaceae bacterium]|jgi:uncharacterized protein YjiS (DUF1127 family)|nr:hypothetical protein [Rhodospirillaceae bacterium]MEA2811202.1 hypothetical protein [Rhodospirillaceae bacterium]MEA2848504.1 hypothetical protein [Rhodospirillaceae bacterium]